MTPLRTGDAFFTPPDYPDGGRHLWIVAAAETGGGNRAVVANVSKRAPYGELMQCVLGPADHGKLKVQSFLRTDWAKCVTQKDLAAVGLDRQPVPFGNDVVRRVQEALLKSPNTAKEVKRALSEILNSGATHTAPSSGAS